MTFSKEVKQRIMSGAKILVAIVGLYLALSKSNISDIEIEFTVTLVVSFLLILCLNFVNILITSLRLKELVKTLPLITSIRINLIGVFFNVIQPSAVGGDIIRVYELNKYSDSDQSSVGIILLDRVIGLSALILIASIFSLISLGTSEISRTLVLISVATSMAMIFAWIIFFVLRKKIHIIEKNVYFIKLPSIIRKKLILLLNTIMNLELKALYKAFGWGALFHILSNLVFHSVVLLVSGLNLSFISSSIINSITNLILILPISIGGLGARDYLYSLFITDTASYPGFVLIGPAIFLIIFLTGAAGGILYLKGDKNID